MSMFKEAWMRVRVNVEEQLDTKAKRRLLAELLDRNVAVVYLSHWPAGTSQIAWNKALEWLDMPVYYDAAARATVEGTINVSNRGMTTRRTV